MYPSGGNNYQYANQYGAPSKSPPPLQHPVPQHPIPDFGTAVRQSSTPSPGLPHLQAQQQQHHYQYNQSQQHQPMMQQAPPPQHQQKMHQTYDPNAYTPQPQMQSPQQPNSNLYSQFGFNDPAAQMGMQFAGSAMAQGSAYVEKNVSNFIHFYTHMLMMSPSLIDGLICQH